MRLLREVAVGRGNLATWGSIMRYRYSHVCLDVCTAWMELGVRQPRPLRTKNCIASSAPACLVVLHKPPLARGICLGVLCVRTAPWC
jgi:hypothetical protein